jgi:hypothetical protein
MIESEGARLRGYDFSALNTVLGTQALALDTIFTQLVREAVENGGLVGRHDLRLALKAQAQSRATLDSLVNARETTTEPGATLGKEFRRTKCCKRE